jgi:hypothetical protein
MTGLKGSGLESCTTLLKALSGTDRDHSPIIQWNHPQGARRWAIQGGSGMDGWNEYHGSAVLHYSSGVLSVNLALNECRDSEPKL